MNENFEDERGQWIDAIFVSTGLCPYCGCSRVSHNRRLRQTSQGLKIYLHCLDCAVRIETQQVVCLYVWCPDNWDEIEKLLKGE